LALTALMGFVKPILFGRLLDLIFLGLHATHVNVFRLIAAKQQSTDGENAEDVLDH
jgi:hypothetical protein